MKHKLLLSIIGVLIIILFGIGFGYLLYRQINSVNSGKTVLYTNYLR